MKFKYIALCVLAAFVLGAYPIRAVAEDAAATAAPADEATVDESAATEEEASTEAATPAAAPAAAEPAAAAPAAEAPEPEPNMSGFGFSMDLKVRYWGRYEKHVYPMNLFQALYRFGVKYNKGPAEVGLAIGSGAGTAPAVEWTILNDGFQRVPITVWEAYGKVNLLSGKLSLTLGRFKNPWLKSEMIFDNGMPTTGADINFAISKTMSINALWMPVSWAGVPAPFSGKTVNDRRNFNYIAGAQFRMKIKPNEDATKPPLADLGLAVLVMDFRNAVTPDVDPTQAVHPPVALFGLLHPSLVAGRTAGKANTLFDYDNWLLNATAQISLPGSLPVQILFDGVINLTNMMRDKNKNSFWNADKAAYDRHPGAGRGFGVSLGANIGKPAPGKAQLQFRLHFVQENATYHWFTEDQTRTGSFGIFLGCAAGMPKGVVWFSSIYMDNSFIGYQDPHGTDIYYNQSSVKDPWRFSFRTGLSWAAATTPKA